MTVDEDPEITGMLIDNAAAKVSALNKGYDSSMKRWRREAGELIKKSVEILFARYPDLQEIMWVWWWEMEYDYQGQRFMGPFFRFPEEWFDPDGVDEYYEWLEFWVSLDDSYDGHQVKDEYNTAVAKIVQDGERTLHELLWQWSYILPGEAEWRQNTSFSITRDGKWTMADHEP